MKMVRPSGTVAQPILPSAMHPSKLALILPPAASFLGGAGSAINHMVLAVLAVALMGFIVPVFVLVLPIYGESVQLALVLYAGMTSDTLSYGGAAAACIGAAAIVLRSTRCRLSLSGSAVLLFLLIWGIVAGIHQLSVLQMLAGARILGVPVVIGIGALHLSPTVRRALLYSMIPFMIASACTSMYQLSVGTRGLLAMGYEYGTNVRTSSGIFRAPGLFATNYQLGMFSAVLLVLLMFLRPPIACGRIGCFLRIAGILAAAVSIMTSNYRTGLLIVAVSAFAFAVRRHAAAGPFRRNIVIAGVIGLSVAFSANGWLSSDSLMARFRLWSSLLFSHLSLLGHGIGSAGSASGSRFSSVRVVTDNYYLDICYQFGVIGVLLLAIIVIGTIRAYVRLSESGSDESMNICLGLGVLAGFATSDAWEHTASMSLVLMFVMPALFPGRDAQHSKYHDLGMPSGTLSKIDDGRIWPSAAADRKEAQCASP